MRTRLIAKAILVGTMLCGSASPNPVRADQAIKNYEALMSGRRQTNQFTPRELADVLALAKALQRKDDRSLSERCVHRETERIGGIVSALEKQVIDMKCRDPGEPLK